MRKILIYELKRLLWNRFFLGILLVLLFAGWQVLSGVTLLGVAHTAPFSPWSFGDYLRRMLPLLWIGALFFLTRFTSGGAQRVAVLTDASPVPPRRYAGVRSAAALLATALLCGLWAPALFVLLPALVFALGAAWRLGQKRPWLVFAWMALPLLLSALPLPAELGLWNGTLFSEYPLRLGTLDPAFSLPGQAVAMQGAFLGAGLAALALPFRAARR